MLYQNQYQKKAHQEIDYIFYTAFPANGLHVRREQILLSHEMLDSLMQNRIDLCDAGVGIGKTYAYLVACIMMRKYEAISYQGKLCDKRPVVLSTSSITLQKALIKEYIPYLSKVLLKSGIIQAPLKAVVRKGKEHFVCDRRLEQRLLAIQYKKKNRKQKEALLRLQDHYDIDDIKDISGFDRRLVCVPKFCPKECKKKETCRYQEYLKRARNTDIYFQICNHNFLLADSVHRANGYKPLLPDYRALIVDEAHKLSEAAKQMYGKTFCYEDIQEVCYYLEREHLITNARKECAVFHNMFSIIRENHQTEYGLLPKFHLTEECQIAIKESMGVISVMLRKLNNVSQKWAVNRLEEFQELLSIFYKQNKKYVYHLSMDKSHLPILCASNKEIPDLLNEMLWKRDIPAILTSGTLRAGNGFGRTKQMIGLEGSKKVREFVAESPFHYKENCMLYLPQDLQRVQHGSSEEAGVLAKHIQKLICSTYGHTLVLFTSYTLMGNVYQILRNSLPFPMVEVWRNAQEEIIRFKAMENAVLFAAGPCWEGVDFPGDMVSSLIIVRLPFAVPDPIREAEKEKYDSLSGYIRSNIIPDMQMKLRQGFGRAIRTETDTCVVSILDYRAVEGGKYHLDVLKALPTCQVTDCIEDVEAFIRSRKSDSYYL